MQRSWNNQQAYYRCTFASEYATANHVRHPRSLYLREAAVLPVLDDWLARLFDPTRREATSALLADSQTEGPGEQAANRAAEEKIAECDTKPARYRSALESGTDPAVVGEWIREVEADRSLARAQIEEQADAPQRLGAEEIAAQLDRIGETGAMTRDAVREAKADLYAGWIFA